MYQKSQLGNHISVVSQEFKDRESIAIGIWVGTGGRFENDRIKGAAHFFEHMAFKGSRKYSCNEIKEKVEGVGGSLNAFTAEEQTCFFAKVPRKHFSQTLDILSDIVFFPNLDKKDLEKERGVILEEIKMYHDLPQFRVVELLDGLLWPNHPLGKSLAGTPESVGSMSVADLRQFHETYYVPSNVVISVCGRVNHKDVVAFVSKKLARTGDKKEARFIPAANDQTAPRVNFMRKDIEQMHVAMGVLGFPTNHDDLYALGLMSVILGGNMSSRLFNEVREKRGLAYAISSGTKSLDDTGIFMIRAGVDNKKIVNSVEVILKELAKVRKNGVTQDEFKRAKDYFLGQFLLGLEDTLDHMLWIGETVISRDRVKSAEGVVEAVNKVKLGDLQRVAGEILSPKRMNLAVVGPLTNAQEDDLRDQLR
jgi:predicted Zn-dependent peptidase